MYSYEQIYSAKNCNGCKHCQAGRWVGWSCRIGVPGDDDEDYSCKTPDQDHEFWVNYFEKL